MKIALTGAEGQLGMAFVQYLREHDLPFQSFGKKDWDICSQDQATYWFNQHGFDLILNCAAFTDVEKAESQSSTCFSVNAEGPKYLAETCFRHHATLIHFSTDYVFDGNKGTAYNEEDAPNPINVYGQSKLLGEKHIQASGCHALIFRISWLFGGEQTGFLSKVNQWMKRASSLRITEDEFSSPTYCHDVPEAVFAMIHQNRPSGVFHLANQGACSRYEWVKYYVETGLQSQVHVQPANSAAFATQARRPKNSSLDIRKISQWMPHPMQDWKQATMEYASKMA